MATPDPSDTVKDREYTNWLKVTLALYYMKSGLHTFIQGEVDCLHQSLVQKIYAGQPVPLSPCTTCNASLVRRNNHTGVWKFQTQCTLSCDVWFCELLALHNNPKSNKIYWANSDVSLWPFKPWECAKVFLPRGQQPTNTGPAESDAQALMVLLANCKHFHPKLSQQGQTLTHKISAIRNQVMHNGEMKLSDADRMSFIQDIIQLLEDPVCLKSLEDCKAALSNIQKIENDSLDVFFNVDTEMKALKAAVNELRLEHGTHEKILNTIDSLKEECKNLREQLTKRFEYAEKELQLHTVRMDTIQRDVWSVKEDTDTALKQQEKKCQEMHAAVTQLSGSMNTMSTCVAKHESRFVAVEENVQAFGRKLEEFETNTPTQKEKNSHRIRTYSGEGISDCDTSASGRRKRPESDGLRQLKNQTEDDLDTFRKRGFIPTSQTEEARKLLQEKRSIVIKGNPGEGKTSTALHLIDNDNYTDWRVVISSPEQWGKVDTKWVKIVVVEDIFGQYDLDPSRLQEWIDTYLKKIQNHVDEGKLQAIITIRDDIFSKASSKLKSFKLFRSDRSLTLCSDELQNADKKNILDRELKRNNKDMTVDKIEQCIANFKGLIGFPQCCTLFAGNEDLFVQGQDFFKSPEKFLVDNIRNLKADSFLSLAFLFCTYKIEEEYLSPSQIKESKKYLPVLQDITHYLYIPFNESTVISLRLSYEHYSGLYVKKVSSCQDHSGENLPYVQHSRENVSKSCIQFSHATIYEAVGQVLGDSYPEIVVKYGGSRYLYQRTYTAEAKDGDSQNVFIPLSVYGLLAERMVHDVVEKKTVESIVKHSSLKQNEFLTKLKEELHKVNRIRDFFMADPYFQHKFHRHVSEGECITFLQHVLQSDDSTVKLVYNHFMEFLACTHNNNSSDCWQCEEKQKLLELALYYHHFEIADQLITMNACYTHVSLYNAARHGDLNRVQMIMEYLKRSQAFNPKCVEAKKALCRAYLSRSQDVIETLLKEGITLDSMHVVHAVQHGDINILMKVVEHLKYHNKWHPHRAFDSRYGSFYEPDLYSYITSATNIYSGSTALYIAYCIEKFDMADYLLQNEAKVSLNMLAAVTEHSSKDAVARVIQDLKVNCIWDPHCDDASQALGKAYVAQKYDVCDMLIQEGVLMTMKNLHCVVERFMTSLKAVKKAVTYLKDTDNWDPKCNDASEALEKASSYHKYDVCDLLIEEGVSVTMKYIPHVILKPLDYVKKVMKQLKDTGRWDPKCNAASKALTLAYGEKKYDVCDLLIEEGVLLTMKNLPCVVMGLNISLEATKKAVQHLKDTNNWDPKCEDVSEALTEAYRGEKYDVCDLLIEEGVSLTMKTLPHVVGGYRITLEAVKKAVQHLKDTKNWDPTCKDASEALEEVFQRKKYDVCDLLIEEGVSLTMKNLPHVIGGSEISLEAVMKAVQHLKDTNNWDPKCEDVSKALAEAYRGQMYDVCDLLIEEGVSLTMKNLPHVVGGFEISLKAVKKAVQHLKDTKNWDPTCKDASETLEEVFQRKKYDVCDLLIEEGVSLTMKNLPHVIGRYEILLEAVMKAVQHLKDTKNWDPKCEDVSKALAEAYRGEKYDVCDLLIEEGVSLTMKNFPHVVDGFEISLEAVKKAVQHLKDTNNWDPKCEDVSEALAEAYRGEKYDVCDLLIEEGVSLTMKNLPHVVGGYRITLEAVKKAVQHLKDTQNWDPTCKDASEALEEVFQRKKYDLCNLLIEEGVSLTMKNLPHVIGGSEISLEAVMKAVQHLKDTNNWDPKCEDALKALAKAYRQKTYDVCDLLIKEGVSLTMKNLPHAVGGFNISLKAVTKAVQHLKDTYNWDPKCDDASKALEEAYGKQKYDVCDFLNQEGVTLTMKNIPVVVYHVSLEKVKTAIQHLNKFVVCDLLIQERVSMTIKNLHVTRTFQVPLETVKKAIEHLKDHENWDPKSDEASEALANAYSAQMYDVCDLLLVEAVSLKMKNFPGVVWGFEVSLEAVKKAMEHLKDTDNLDPKCDDASKALANAYSKQKYDVCDLLIQEGVLLTMQTLDGVVEGFQVSLEAVKKALQHLKNTDNWDPSSEHASKALENAYVLQKYDVCDLLLQEGVSLSMKNVPGVVYSVSLEYVNKAIQHLNRYDLFYLLVLKRVSLAMKNLPCAEGRSRVSLEAVKKVIQHLKDTGKWDPGCVDASKALANARSAYIHDVCDLLVQEGVLPNNEESSSYGAGCSGIIESS